MRSTGCTGAGRAPFAGAGDLPHLLLSGAEVTIAAVIAAAELQCAAIEKLGGRIILMAARALAATARMRGPLALRGVA